MDVETTMRINQLMRELKKHGIAVTAEDAYQKAEKMMNPSQKTQAQEGPPEDKTPTQKQDTQTSSAELPNTALLQRQVELMIQMNTRRQEEAITAINEQVLTLQAELKALRQELSSLKNIPIPSDTKKKIKIQPADQQTLKSQPKESHPRQGEFQPGSVDIKKYFYFGSK